MKRITYGAIGLIAMGLALLSTPASALFYFGNPNINYHCSYMSADEPDWIVEDQMAGSSSQNPNLVTTVCDDAWASVHLGAQDLDPGSGWKYNVIVESDAHNPSPDETVCRLYANGVLHWTVHVFARL